VEGVDRGNGGDGRGIDRVAVCEQRSSTGPAVGGVHHQRAQAAEEDLDNGRRVLAWPGWRRTGGAERQTVEFWEGAMSGRGRR
jgi:hypothetical protein